MSPCTYDKNQQNLERAHISNVVTGTSLGFCRWWLILSVRIGHLHLGNPSIFIEKICLWLNRKKMGQQCRRNRSNTCYLLLQYSETTKSVEQPTNSARDRGAWRPRAKGPCNIRYPHRLRAFLPGTCCVNHNKLTFWMVGDTIPSRS